MKKHQKLTWLIALLFSCITLTSCDDNNDDWIVDWSPVTLHIFVQNELGENIAQPQMPGLTLTFQGKTYQLQPSPVDGASRAIMPVFEGFYYEHYHYTAAGEEAVGHLCYGQLDGAADMDEDFILTWPDGSTDTIHYHCSNHNERKITCKRYCVVNGEKQEGENVHLTKVGYRVENQVK